MENPNAAGVHGEQYVESHGQEGFYTYEEGLTCTDKCRGIHDAAVAEMVGATSCHLQGDVCHGGHYGLGFANFQNPTGDTVTFKLHMCNAGRHRIAITYALANDDPPRPLDVQINGVESQNADGTSSNTYQSGQRGVNFPATGVSAVALFSVSNPLVKRELLCTELDDMGQGVHRGDAARRREHDRAAGRLELRPQHRFN